MKTEILAPAGDEQSARAALYRGADAVYLGLTRFSAREGAENFDLSALERTVRLARIFGAKVYLCLNTLIKDGETDDFFSAARQVCEAGADAILVQDLFLGKALKETYPEITLHLSTQAGCCNERGARLAKEYGFSRVVLARETPIAEIRKIAAVIETEVFVQGALCSCFSGQCYLSSFAGNNSGNRGRCKQPCRKKYKIDRIGFEDYAYALSPSDLSVGTRVKELLEAGVVSLKIEGRMRRPEYVSAAVRYFRALLAGSGGDTERTELTRAYNRGDYTYGLAFGQNRFLSRKVQGHIGEKVGEIALRGGYYCKSGYRPGAGDGFKILRDGYEVGGAAFLRADGAGFYLSSREKLRAGDEVRLTTDAALSRRPFPERTRELRLSLRFIAGERAYVCGEGIEIAGEILQSAKSAPLTEEELKAAFRKTDGLPFAVEFDCVETKGAFLPKSALNAFRRSFFEKLLQKIAPRRELPERSCTREIDCVENRAVAVIATDFTGLKSDILVYKPRDFMDISENEVRKGSGRKFLYLPPFFTSADEKKIIPVLPLFKGIYCDGYYGLSLASAHGMDFFAGTGFNLSNRFAVSELKKAGAKYFALSKELSAPEQAALSAEGAFTLTLGAVKVMDLIYCPFERSCQKCDKREMYTLTDEDGRQFPLRRYATGEGCRFEVYNCAPLAGERVAGALVDLSAGEDKALAGFAARPAEGAALLKNPTKGHARRSLL